MNDIQKQNCSWLDLTTSLFSCPADNYGKPRTFRQILFSDFAVPHDWYFAVYDPEKRWVSDNSNDLDTIIEIRNGVSDEDKNLLKQTLQCYTPSACYKNKSRDESKRILIHINHILQLDFDKLDNFDIQEVKRAIFSLPFVCYCGLSVSGKGLFVLILIREPEKLTQYAEHCFAVFNYLGLLPDISKGRNYSDLRFVSHDANGLCREYPQPLKIKKFHAVKKTKIEAPQSRGIISDNALIKWGVKLIQAAQVKSRFDTVVKVAYTLGGYGIGLSEIKDAINNSPQYAGLESKYLHHADECYQAGQSKKLTA